jgi:DNA repair proteins
MKIKDLAKVDRPREKLEKYGPEKLATAELLAVLLGSGIKGLNVVELSRKIVKLIAKNGTEKIKLEDLLKEKGLGKAKALQIIAALEFGKRMYPDKKPEILTPEDVWKLCGDFRGSKKSILPRFIWTRKTNSLNGKLFPSARSMPAWCIRAKSLNRPLLCMPQA